VFEANIQFFNAIYTPKDSLHFSAHFFCVFQGASVNEIVLQTTRLKIKIGVHGLKLGIGNWGEMKRSVNGYI